MHYIWSFTIFQNYTCSFDLQFVSLLRNVGIGIASLGGRVGNIVAPYTPFIVSFCFALNRNVFALLVMSAANVVIAILLP